MKIVSISVSPRNEHDRCYSSGAPEQVINYNWGNNYWCSSDTPGSWLEIDFKQRKAKINGYSLKSRNSFTGNCNLKNWVIEGSNNKQNWVETDSKINNQDLNRQPFEHYFPVAKGTDAFQYIRIRSTGLCHWGHNCISLTNIEFYGEITSI